jgi:hypothetical protein
MRNWVRVRPTEVTAGDLLALVVGGLLLLVVGSCAAYQVATHEPKPSPPPPQVEPAQPGPTLPTTEEVGEGIGRRGVQFGRGLLNGAREEMAK